MSSKHFLLCCAIVANLVLTIAAGCATRATDQLAGVAAVPLTNTEWRLSQLGGLLPPPAQPGSPAVGLRLQAQNTRVEGFSGCNRMSGAYALDGQSLKFAQMGGTKMACADDARTSLEQQYLRMFFTVARWKIRDRTLELLDAQGKTVATFLAADSGV